MCSPRSGPRRKRRHVILLFSARGEQSDRLVGLELGADDYIAKRRTCSLARKIEYLLENKPPRESKKD